MGGSKTIGGINVTITATIDKFAKALTLGRRLMGQFVKAVKNTIFSLKGLAVALTVGAFAKFTISQFRAIDALKDLSDTTGISAAKLAGLQLAAAEVGVSNELLERSLVTLNKKMGMVGDRALRKWIEDTSKLGSQQEKLAAATEMFGKKGASMVRFLTGGTAALDEAQRAAESLGLALDKKTVMGVDRALDAFGRFKMAVSGIFRSLAAELAPFIEVLSNKMTDFLATNGRGKGIGSAIANAIVNMAKFVADGVAKMVAAVLDMTGHVLLFIRQFRDEAPKWMGVGFRGKDDAFNMEMRGAGLINQANAIRANLPGAAIQSAIDEARKGAAKDAGPNLGLSDFMGKMLGKSRTSSAPTLTNAKQIGAALWGGFARGIQSLPGVMVRGMLTANGMTFDKKAGGVGGFNSLAAQDPTSREGRSQAIRSMAAAQFIKTGEKQLKEQQKANGWLEKIAQGAVQLKAANL